jgi:hypothetical protein
MLQATPGILAQTSSQEASDGLRRVRGQPVPVRLGFLHLAEQLGYRPALECRASRQHLEQHATESPDIRPLVDWLSARLLRTHVRRRAEDRAVDGAGDCRRGLQQVGTGPVATHRLCDAEVEHLYDTLGCDLDVGRLQVSMDDALLMRGLEGVGNLRGDRQGVDERQRPASDPLGQCVAFHELEHERPDSRLP